MMKLGIYVDFRLVLYIPHEVVIDSSSGNRSYHGWLLVCTAKYIAF